MAEIFMRRLFIRLIAFACLFTLLTHDFSVSSTSFVTRAQVRTSYNEGAVGLGLLLRRLQTTASVLHTGAHPDDEDSALIARLARGDGARVAYLSLNRGEGGQNRIGAELFDAPASSAPKNFCRRATRRRRTVFHARLRLRFHETREPRGR